MKEQSETTQNNKTASLNKAQKGDKSQTNTSEIFLTLTFSSKA